MQKRADTVVLVVVVVAPDPHIPRCHQHVIHTSPDAQLRRVVIIGRNVLVGQTERMRYQVMRRFSGCQKKLIPPIHSKL